MPKQAESAAPGNGGHCHSNLNRGNATPAVDTEQALRGFKPGNVGKSILRIETNASTRARSKSVHFAFEKQPGEIAVEQNLREKAAAGGVLISNNTDQGYSEKPGDLQTSQNLFPVFAPDARTQDGLSLPEALKRDESIPAHSVPIERVDIPRDRNGALQTWTGLEAKAVRDFDPVKYKLQLTNTNAQGYLMV